MLSFVTVLVGIALLQVSRIAGIVVVVVGMLSFSLFYTRDRKW